MLSALRELKMAQVTWVRYVPPRLVVRVVGSETFILTNRTLAGLSWRSHAYGRQYLSRGLPPSARRPSRCPRRRCWALAGRLSQTDDARRGEHGSQEATLGETWVESDHAHCMTVVRHMTISLLFEPQAPVLDDVLYTMSGLPARLERRTLR